MKTSFDEIKRMSFRALDAGRAPAGVDEDSAITTGIRRFKPANTPAINSSSNRFHAQKPSSDWGSRR